MIEMVIGKTKIELARRRFGRHMSLYRRRTWTLDEKNWITDYGVEVFRFAFWVHIPDSLMRIFC
jgi:hypothetical protein